MADYHFPTVVEPFIPETDMTPLERLVLGLVFDEETEDGLVYFHSSCGPSDVVTMSFAALRGAYEGSPAQGSSIICRHVEVLIAKIESTGDRDPADEVDLDLSDVDIGWHGILQDIVRRSTTIDEIVVTAAFTCSRMRPDGFGGSVMLITPDAILYRSTTRMLDALRAEAAGQTPPPRSAGA